jgi:hypothetical protein
MQYIPIAYYQDFLPDEKVWSDAGILWDQDEKTGKIVIPEKWKVEEYYYERNCDYGDNTEIEQWIIYNENNNRVAKFKRYRYSGRNYVIKMNVKGKKFRISENY